MNVYIVCFDNEVIKYWYPKVEDKKCATFWVSGWYGWQTNNDFFLFMLILCVTCLMLNSFYSTILNGNFFLSCIRQPCQSRLQNINFPGHLWEINEANPSFVSPGILHPAFVEAEEASDGRSSSTALCMTGTLPTPRNRSNTQCRTEYCQHVETEITLSVGQNTANM